MPNSPNPSGNSPSIPSRSVYLAHSPSIQSDEESEEPVHIEQSSMSTPSSTGPLINEKESSYSLEDVSPLTDRSPLSYSSTSPPVLEQLSSSMNSSSIAVSSTNLLKSNEISPNSPNSSSSSSISISSSSNNKPKDIDSPSSDDPVYNNLKSARTAHLASSTSVQNEELKSLRSKRDGFSKSQEDNLVFSSKLNNNDNKSDTEEEEEEEEEKKEKDYSEIKNDQKKQKISISNQQTKSPSEDTPTSNEPNYQQDSELLTENTDDDNAEALLTPEDDDFILTPPLNTSETNQNEYNLDINNNDIQQQLSNSEDDQRTSLSKNKTIDEQDRWGSPPLIYSNSQGASLNGYIIEDEIIEKKLKDDTSIAISKPLRNHRALLDGCLRVEIFKKLNKISEGTYGTVFRASNTQNGETVALKQIKYHKKLWEEGFPITSLREISILLELDHPNIVLVKEVVVGSNPHQVYMVMEYVEHEMKTLLDSNKPEFSVSERKCLLLQLLRAIDYLHKNWVIHRDLKTSNLLYTNKGLLKLCDFGMARKFGDPIRPYTHNVVTLWYRAPELILGQQKYTEAIDLWSAGCIFGEMILRKPLFPGHGEEATLKRIFNLCGYPTENNWPGFSKLPAIRENRFPRFPENRPNWRETFPFHSNYYSSASGSLSEAGLDLLQKLLELCPERRITASQALQHPYFTAEKPHPQPTGMMPTVPDTNSQTRRKKQREKSIDPDEIKLQEAFHDASFRFGGRIDAEQFLSELDQQKQSKNTIIQTSKI